MSFRLLFLLLFSITLYAKEQLIPITFENLDLKQLINISSKILDKSILVNSEVNGKVNFISTKPLKKSSLLSILKVALKNNGLKLHDSGSFYSINKLEEKKIKTKIKTETNIEIISLKNIEAKNLIKIVDSFIKNQSLKVFSSLNSDSNSLVLAGNKNSLKLLKNLVSKLDKDELQLYLKAKIVELNSSLVKEVGVKYGLFSKQVDGSDIYSISSSLNSSKTFLSEIKGLNVSVPTLSSSLALGASLSLLHQNYALNILSEPSILCINNKKSLIYVGESISLQNASTVSSGGNTSYSFERKDVGLRLEVRPRVSNDKVRLEINTLIETVKNSSTNNQPDTMKKEVSTTAIVKNGESIILGGLIEQRSENQKDDIPGLSSLPIFGKLFSYKNNRNEKRSLAIIITPYIIPKAKDLTFIAQELAKLKKLEAKILEKSLEKAEKKKEKELELSYEEEHKRRVKEIFNF